MTEAEKDYLAAKQASPETIQQAMAQADAAIAEANRGMSYRVEPGHNHTDTWPCNASCPAHPDFAKARAEAMDEFDVALELTQSLEGVKAEMAAKDARIAELEAIIGNYSDGIAQLILAVPLAFQNESNKDVRIRELEGVLFKIRNEMDAVMAGK